MRCKIWKIVMTQFQIISNKLKHGFWVLKKLLNTVCVNNGWVIHRNSLNSDDVSTWNASPTFGTTLSPHLTNVNKEQMTLTLTFPKAHWWNTQWFAEGKQIQFSEHLPLSVKILRHHRNFGTVFVGAVTQQSKFHRFLQNFYTRTHTIT